MNEKNVWAFFCAAFFNLTFAQTQLYGNVDYGYTLRYQPTSGTTQRLSQINGGLSTDNFLGLKGEETFRADFRAFFTLERSFRLDTGEDYEGFDLTALFGVNSPLGTLQGGKMLTPYHECLSWADPFEAGSVGTYQNIKSDVAPIFLGDRALLDPDRIHHALSYTSPNFNGFSVNAAYSNKALGEKNQHFHNVAMDYATPNALLFASYHRLKTMESQTQNFSVGGNCDFEVFKLFAFYALDEVRLGEEKFFQQRNVLVGANFPLGKQTIKTSFHHSHNTHFGNAFQVATGYDYALSARNAFFVVYALIHQDFPSQKRLGRWAAVNDTQNEGRVYQRALQMGLRHAF